ncbi:flavin monoamine oxidase family protein [Roseomonas elaeocarpi]|uniref:Tryptophan 2-monooxygenase n=1 Tax=Roseomonas elaeocarpi TaxID=907779 RepID=A0ABV6JV85_9PROT
MTYVRVCMTSSSNASHDADVLILGAGAAGIAAACACRRLGLQPLVLEARGRLGGRASTDHSLGGPVDLGATWLHAAEHNPLVPLAREMGLELADHDALRAHRMRLEDGWADEAAMAEFEEAWDAWIASLRAAEQRLAPEEDATVLSVAPRGGRWDATVGAWEGPTIAAAELGQLGLRDFLANQLEGGNLLPAIGMGALLTRLGEGLPVRLNCPATRLGRDRDGIWVETPAGRLRARGAVVTLPTPTLTGEAATLRFEGGLPPAVEEALNGLPLGLLSKIILPAAEGTVAADGSWLGLPPFATMDRAVGEGETRITFVARPFGRTHLEGFAGGDLAWTLSREGPRAEREAALEELVRLLGADARRAVAPERAIVSDWGRSPWSRGGYSYALPGARGARAVLRQPLFDGRVALAGEHCHDTRAGTVGGAWDTGEAAVARLAEVLRPGGSATDRP